MKVVFSSAMSMQNKYWIIYVFGHKIHYYNIYLCKSNKACMISKKKYEIKFKRNYPQSIFKPVFPFWYQKVQSECPHYEYLYLLSAHQISSQLFLLIPISTIYWDYLVNYQNNNFLLISTTFLINRYANRYVSKIISIRKKDRSRSCQNYLSV